MRTLSLASLVLVAAYSTSVAQTVPTAVRSPQGLALVAAVQASLDDARERQARLPPPRDDAERIVRLGELDQAPRKVVTTFDWSRIPDEDRDASFRAQAAIMDTSDHEILAQLMALLPPEGWFLKSRYGPDAAGAAFLIVQHADAGALHRFLPKLQELAKSGEVDGQSTAMMFDRVAISEGRPQRYGTQFRCDGGKWRPYPLEDEAQVDELRKSAGVPISFEEFRKLFAAQPPCPQTPRPAPPGMKLD